ncbi:hypothetical protein PR048_002929 [Dryococelus australis]|uniref:Uncharacterized protein n=1 Tax=Dryococelus australis TaxID=614101 RepID=A0ABQ9IN36_9NEOP|nr:hypothetical protein PR048_002929 [Dryococelus australis]
MDVCWAGNGLRAIHVPQKTGTMACCFFRPCPACYDFSLFLLGRHAGHGGGRQDFRGVSLDATSNLLPAQSLFNTINQLRGAVCGRHVGLDRRASRIAAEGERPATVMISQCRVHPMPFPPCKYVLLVLCWFPKRNIMDSNLVKCVYTPTLLGYGLTVAERLACSSPTKANGSIPSWVTLGCSRVGIVPDDAAGRWVFPGISRFPRPIIPALLHSQHKINYPLRFPRPRYLVTVAVMGQAPQRLNHALPDMGVLMKNDRFPLHRGCISSNARVYFAGVYPSCSKCARGLCAASTSHAALPPSTCRLSSHPTPLLGQPHKDYCRRLLRHGRFQAISQRIPALPPGASCEIPAS